MTKYQQIFLTMLSEHEKEFSEFKIIHDKYAADQKKWELEFNKIGKPIVEIIRGYESKLCGKMESGSKAVFSSNLSDKFWNGVRQLYPYIDFVGVKVD